MIVDTNKDLYLNISFPPIPTTVKMDAQIAAKTVALLGYRMAGIITSDEASSKLLLMLSRYPRLSVIPPPILVAGKASGSLVVILK